MGAGAGGCSRPVPPAGAPVQAPTEARASVVQLPSRDGQNPVVPASKATVATNFARSGVSETCAKDYAHPPPVHMSRRGRDRRGRGAALLRSSRAAGRGGWRRSAGKPRRRCGGRLGKGSLSGGRKRGWNVQSKRAACCQGLASGSAGVRDSSRGTAPGTRASEKCSPHPRARTRSCPLALASSFLQNPKS
jgi:hypothetical protein